MSFPLLLFCVIDALLVSGLIHPVKNVFQSFCFVYFAASLAGILCLRQQNRIVPIFNSSSSMFHNLYPNPQELLISHRFSAPSYDNRTNRRKSKKSKHTTKETKKIDTTSVPTAVFTDATSPITEYVPLIPRHPVPLASTTVSRQVNNTLPVFAHSDQVKAVGDNDFKKKNHHAIASLGFQHVSLPHTAR